ncbi:unnamed protein product [Ixodes pacificus]
MLRLRCGLQKIESVGEFFCGAYLKKGEKLHKHAFSVEEIIDGPTNEVKAKCVSQVRLNVVYDICLQVSVIAMNHYWRAFSRLVIAINHCWHAFSRLLSRSLRTVVIGTCSCRAGVAGRCKHCSSFFVFFLFITPKIPHASVGLSSGANRVGSLLTTPTKTSRICLEVIFVPNLPRAQLSASIRPASPCSNAILKSRAP